MAFSFNLIDQPWIPCQASSGESVELNLYDFLIRSPELWRIAGETPVVNISILALAIAVLCRVFDMADDEAWSRLRLEGSFPRQPLEEYLGGWYDRFDLFHPERPFYQAPDDRVERKSVIHLVQPIGNTGTLFTHQNEADGVALSPKRAVQHLLAAQLFRTAGLSGLDEKFGDAPFARGVLYWAWGDTVFETLLLNCIVPPQDRMPQDNDSPCWELDDPFGDERETPRGYLDYLTWQTNRILLFPERSAEGVRVREMTIAPARRLDTEVIFSPLKRYEKRKPPKDAPDEVKYSFQKFDENRDLWRDYATLLPLRGKYGDAPPYLPPTAIDRLANLAADEYVERGAEYRLMACGMLAVQAKVFFYRQVTVPLPVELLRDAGAANSVSEAIREAEEVSKILSAALRELARHTIMRGGSREPDSSDVGNLVKRWDAQAWYWSQLEPAFWVFVESLSTSHLAALNDWRETLRAAAIGALQAAIRAAGTDTGPLKGESLAIRKLSNGLKKLWKPDKAEQEQ
jgi:CRISPR system Cascade subunit CasA